jgi:hypothetical protein
VQSENPQEQFTLIEREVEFAEQKIFLLKSAFLHIGEYQFPIALPLQKQKYKVNVPELEVSMF